MGWFQDIVNFVTAPLRESAAIGLTENLLLPPGGGFDPDLNLAATQGGSLFYRRLTRDLARDLNPITEERGREIVWALYMTNPMGRRILQLQRDYILSDGVQIRIRADKAPKGSKPKDEDTAHLAVEDEAASAALQRVVDKFWHDPANNMDIELMNKVLELGLFGEQCYPIVVNPKDGSVRLGYIDPAMILRVDRDPKTKRPLAVVTKEFPTNNLQSEVYKIVAVDDDPSSDSYGRLMGVFTDDDGNIMVDDERNYLPSDNDQVSGLSPTGEMPTEVAPQYLNPDNVAGEGKLMPQNRARQYRYAGACFYFAVNKVTNATRGTPDLLTVADWIDAYDQFLFARLERELLMNNFVWDVTVAGGTKQAIDEFLKANPPPKPGTVRAHNERVTWEAVTPKMESKEAAQDADLFSAQVATGAALPKTWINSGLDVNKASAPELAEPSWKSLAMRQRYVRYMIETMVRFVLDQAEMSGRVARRPMIEGELLPEAWNIEITMPDIRARDIANAGDVLAKVATALAVAKADDAIDTQVEQDVLALLIEQLGIEVDKDAMRVRVQKEKAEDEARALTIGLGSSRAKAFGKPGPGTDAVPGFAPGESGLEDPEGRAVPDSPSPAASRASGSDLRVGRTGQGSSGRSDAVGAASR